MKMTFKRAPGFTAFSLLMPCFLLGLLAGCKTNPQTAAALQRLQGTWEGGATITITGNSLRYQQQDNWYEATFILPVKTSPQQLRATITAFTNSPGAIAIGEVITAIYKIEDGTLDLTEEPIEGSSDTARYHYKLRKVQPQQKNAGASTSK